MNKSEKAIFTNMCMVFDHKGKVLVLDKKNPEWGGITFPGGHVEKGESFTDSVIREVYEETGLHILCPQLCGIKQWPHRDGSRYVVLLYKTNQFQGDISSSEEGDVSWMNLEDMLSENLAEGMDKMLRVFLEDEISEYLWYEDAGTWKDVLK